LHLPTKNSPRPMGQIVFKPSIQNVSQLGVVSGARSDLIPDLHRLVKMLSAHQTGYDWIGGNTAFSFFRQTQGIPKSQTIIVTSTFDQILREGGANFPRITNRSPKRLKVIFV